MAGNILKLKNKELVEEITGEAKQFPKYATPIINLANYYAKGTAPDVVGQMSDLIQECPYNEYEKWKTWYLAQRPDAIDAATKKVLAMLNNMKKVINQIDEAMVRKWVEDLVIDKTFIGLKFQEAILKRIAKLKGTSYRLAAPNEESKGIDGFVGKTPVSIKPASYKTKNMLMENIEVKIVFYEKKKDGIVVDMGALG